jgi:DHA1 family tetracycline resistance protein-like MFS transporter
MPIAQRPDDRRDVPGGLIASAPAAFLSDFSFPQGVKSATPVASCETEGMRSRQSVLFVLIAVFIDMVGIGIAIPVLPKLIGAYTVTRETQAYWNMALLAAYSGMQFLCAPMLGAISDRFGRRTVLIAAIVGLGIHYFLIATAPSLWIMLLARLIGGTTGASFSVANAYLADITPPEQRAKNFGLVGAAFGLGFICGPILGGILGSIDLHLPFYVAAGLSLVNATYGFLFVPESLPAERRSGFTLAKANPFRALAALIRHHAVGTLVIVYGVYFIAHMTMIQSWVLATQFRFNWGPRQNGYLLFCVGLVSTIVQGGLIGRLVKRFGEEKLILMAVGSNVIVQTLYGLAPAGWMMYPILFASVLTFTAGPSIQGAVSKTTPAKEQGVTMGALQSISALAGVLGPICGNWLLAQVASLPPGDLRLGVNFYFCAALNALAFTIALRWRARAPQPVPSH